MGLVAPADKAPFPCEVVMPNRKSTVPLHCPSQVGMLTLSDQHAFVFFLSCRSVGLSVLYTPLGENETQELNLPKEPSCSSAMLSISES